MARPIQITRRIKSTKFAVEYVDITEKKIKNIETRLFGDWRERTKKETLKVLEKNFDHVLDYKVIDYSERLYAMTEETFLHYAQEIPNRNVRAAQIILTEVKEKTENTEKKGK